MTNQIANAPVASNKAAANINTPLRYCHLGGGLGISRSGFRPASMLNQFSARY
jgi:hypothetical protein